MKQIEGNVGFLLVQCCRAHRNRAEAALNELGLHVGQEIFLLRLLQEDGQTQTQLAECMCVEPPTLSKMVQRMEAAGFVARRPDSGDARVSRVYITERGKAMEQPILTMWSNMENCTLSGLTETEQALLRRLLLQIHSNIS